MASLTSQLSQIVGQAFAAQGLPAELGAVQVSDRPDLAQFQCNGAMAAARIAKKAPRQVAEEVVSSLKTNQDLSEINIAGPGFININVTDEFLAAFLADTANSERLKANQVEPETVVLDYGGPNIAKPMHVGHLRAAIIGDSLRRITNYAGYKVLGDVHMGDWGTQLGMVISEYIKTGQTERVLDTDLKNDNAVLALMEELSAIYPQVSATCKENEDRKKEALEATVKMQNKESPYFDLWKVIRAASIKGMKANYELLDVHFDLWKGEADVHDLISPTVKELKAKGLAEEDQGALIVRVDREDDKKEMPPLILYKGDGAVMYGTTDLATIVERMQLYSPSKIIYIVDQRQHLHFEQVFRAARLAGIAPEEGVELTHAGFGTMNGPDGKPFKTRAGGVMKLEDLIAMAIDKARQRLAEADLGQDMAESEKEDVAHKVAIAAIRFADLQNQRHADYVFDLDRLTSFEGKTGPYLLYQAVRISSLLSKADEAGYKIGEKFTIEDTDRPLALLLTQFPESFEASLRNYMPHHLCDYAYRLAQEFSRFYSSCHILSETDENIRKSRLALCALTVKTLKTALELLGTAVPARM